MLSKAKGERAGRTAPGDSVGRFLAGLRSYVECWKTLQIASAQPVRLDPCLTVLFERARANVVGVAGYDRVCLLWERLGHNLQSPGPVLQIVERWRAELAIELTTAAVDSMSLARLVQFSERFVGR